jgi:septum formation protein
MINPSIKLILASRSPRRRQLLAEAGYRFEVCPPSDEAEGGLRGNESPADLVARLARQKAADVVERIKKGTVPYLLAESEEKGTVPFSSDENWDSPRDENRDSPQNILVLGCDTVVECDGRILGKPDDEADARKMLETLSGREHRVLTGLCLWKVPCGESLVRVAATMLRMDRLGKEQLDDYLAGGQWQGKAGAFGYQDRLGWIHVISGSRSNVVGLPLELLAEMLEAVWRC